MEGGSAPNTTASATSEEGEATVVGKCVSFHILFSNITTWGSRVVEYLMNDTSHIQSVVEHHVPVNKLHTLKNDAKALGRDFYGTAASPSLKSQTGTSAGVAILPQRRLAVSQPSDSALEMALGLQEAQYARWYPVNIRLKHVTVTYIVVYLFTAEGLSPRNQEILHQIYLYMSLVNGPFVVVGDWQVHPTILAGSAWFSLVNLEFAIPVGLTATCQTSGGSASMIDYFLVSSCLVPVISVQPVFDVPWKPHIGLRLSISSSPREVVAPVIRSPKPLPPLPLSEEGDHVLDERVWQQAVSFSSSFLEHKTDVGILNLSKSDSLALHPVQLTLGKSFAKACIDMEVYSCLMGGVAMTSKDLTPYIGRGHFPRFVLKPLVHRSYGTSKFRCPHANFWCTLETCLAWIVSTDSSGINLMHNINLTRKLVGSLAFHWSGRAAPNCPAHAWQTWADNLTTNNIITQQVGYNHERLVTWKSRASAQKEYFLRAAKTQSNLRFTRWIEKCLKDNVGALHSMVKAAQPTFVHSSAIQAQFSPWHDAWAARWCTQPQSSPSCVEWASWKQQLSCIVSAVAVPRNHNIIVENPIPTAFLPDELKYAAKAYPSRKKLGSDFLATSDLYDLPSQVLAPFVNVLNFVQSVQIWPPQLLLNLFSLIPKAISGSRAIAKTPIFYRLWCILRSAVVKQWAADTCPAWEYASAGRSALDAATTHQWVNELAHVSGNTAAAILWDIQQYFDSIQWHDIRRVARLLGYPPVDLNLAMAMHAAPRVLCMAGASSMAMVPSRSVLQGCFHSKFLASMITYYPVDRIHREQREDGHRRPAITHTFVDDVSQFNIGSPRVVLRTLAHAGVSIVGSFRALNLTISSKSVVLSTSKALAAAIAKIIYTYTAHKLPVKASARDLGVLHSTARVRRTGVLDQRFTKAISRLKRIAPLAKRVRSARILTSTGALPQALWGHQSLGVAPSALRRLRAAAAVSTAIGGAGRCTSTAIALSLGPDRGPAITIADQQVRLFFSLFKSDATLRALTVRHWCMLRDPLLTEEGEIRWNKAFGPTTGTIATLAQYGWTLQQAHVWTDHTGKVWEADMNLQIGLLRPFLDAVKTSVSSHIWREAANFHNGNGLQNGVEWFGTLALRNHLLKGSADNDLQFSDVPEEIVRADQLTWPENPVVWLELFMVGGYWSNLRFSQARPNSSPRCERCGAEIEDDHHLIWECPANADIPSPHILASQYLVAQSRTGAETHQCLWLRGLLPSSIVPNNTPCVEQDELHFVGDRPTGMWPGGLYFSDCSGGQHSAIPLLRRCGVGVCQLHEEICLEGENPQQPMRFGLFAPLPGTVHTVVRGELYAILLVVRLVCIEAVVTVASDSKVNVDLFDKGKPACLQTNNADLWEELFNLVEGKSLSLCLRWVKGHCTTDELINRYNMNFYDIVGNLTADALANRAAQLYQCVPQDIIDVQWYYSLVRKIQSRAIAILAAVIPRRGTNPGRTAAIPRPISTPLGVAVLGSQHKFTLFSGSARCYICFETAPRMRSHLLDWLASPCKVDVSLANAFFSGRQRPAKLPLHRPIPVGRQVAHESHSLCVFRGLVYCNSCGYYAHKKMQHLAEPCSVSPEDKAAVLRVLNFRRGKLPSGMADWPNGCHHSMLTLL